MAALDLKADPLTPGLSLWGSSGSANARGLFMAREVRVARVILLDVFGTMKGKDRCSFRE